MTKQDDKEKRMRSMRFRTIAILGVAGVLSLAVGIPGASANHTSADVDTDEVPLFDVSAGGEGQTIKIPLTVSVGGQKVLGPADQGYLVSNEVAVDQVAAGASVIGSISGELRHSEGPTAVACANGKPGQQFRFVSNGGFLDFDLALVTSGALGPASTQLSSTMLPVPIADEGTTVEATVCKN